MPLCALHDDSNVDIDFVPEGHKIHNDLTSSFRSASFDADIHIVFWLHSLCNGSRQDAEGEVQQEQLFAQHARQDAQARCNAADCTVRDSEMQQRTSAAQEAKVVAESERHLKALAGVEEEARAAAQAAAAELFATRQQAEADAVHHARLLQTSQAEAEAARKESNERQVDYSPCMHIPSLRLDVHFTQYCTFPACKATKMVLPTIAIVWGRWQKIWHPFSLTYAMCALLLLR